MLTTETMIGPLTAAEWLSMRLGAPDDFLQCCHETSDIRDAVFHTLRMGADADQDAFLRDVWPTVESHGLADHPIMRKLHAFYVEGKDPLPPDSALAEMLAVDSGYINSMLQAVPDVFDLADQAGRIAALGRVASKVAYVLDPADRSTCVAALAGLLRMDVSDVARVVDAFRGNAGLPFDAPTVSPVRDDA